MIRALVYTDLQATDGHEKCHADPTKSLQIYRVTKLYEDLYRIYQDHQCNALWDLGDTTDDRTALPVPAINAVCAGLAKFPRNDWDIKLVGNHEQYLRNTEVNVGRMFDPYFRVIEKPDVFAVSKHTQVLLCPFPADEADLKAWIGKQHKSGVRSIMLGHFQIAGCYGNSGQLMTGISLADLAFLKVGLLGHIHRPQQLSNCYYVGSPFQQNWGEAGENKRVAIVDILPDEVRVSWVPLLGYPEYRALSLADFAAQAQGGEEHRYRVILKTQAEAAEFYASPYAHLAEPQYEFTTAAPVEASGESKSASAWTPEQTLRRYLERNDPAEKGIQVSKDEMLTVGLDMLTP